MSLGQSPSVHVELHDGISLGYPAAREAEGGGRDVHLASVLNHAGRRGNLLNHILMSDDFGAGAAALHFRFELAPGTYGWVMFTVTFVSSVRFPNVGVGIW